MISNRAVSLQVALSAAAFLLAPAASAVTIDWTYIGDPGNPADSQVMTGDPSPEGNGTTGYGSVAYVYNVGTYEVTNAQYAEFLNAVADADTGGLYPVGPAGIIQGGNDGSYTYSLVAGLENTPVRGLSLWDAVRFANWIQNGQPVGPQGPATTEDGSYTITAQGIATDSVTRNPGTTIFLASENEWYKAAYYSPLGVYFDYPAGTDVQTACVAPAGDTGNSANCANAAGGFTDVGAYSLSASPYGTLDQGGNVFEWTDTIHQDSSGLYRVKRGGGSGNDSYSIAEQLSASVRYGVLADFDSDGFRLVMIPEPGSGLLAMTGLLGLAYQQRSIGKRQQ